MDLEFDLDDLDAEKDMNGMVRNEGNIILHMNVF